MEIPGVVKRRLLSENDVAYMLSCSVQTLRNHRWKGKGLPYIKLGRMVKYDYEEVLEYIEKKRIHI